jgi:hypothetical protein
MIDNCLAGAVNNGTSSGRVARWIARPSRQALTTANLSITNCFTKVTSENDGEKPIMPSFPRCLAGG